MTAIETPTCLFCPPADDPVVIRDNGYTGRQCQQCGLIYVSPRPTTQAIRNLYSRNGAHISAERHIADGFEKRLYARHHLRLLRRHIRQGSLLEIGAGAGYFLDEARQQGFQPHGLEINSRQAAFIRDQLGIPCETGTIAESFPGQTFDVIYHADVLSHLTDPVAEFQTMADRLRPGGFLMFETGNLADMDRRYDSLIPSFQYPDHLYLFGQRSLRELLLRSGFMLEAMHRYSILPQLRVRRAFIRRSEQNGRGTGTRSGWLQRLAALGFYALRYPVGHFARKDGRPQTLLVVASMHLGLPTRDEIAQAFMAYAYQRDHTPLCISRREAWAKDECDCGWGLLQVLIQQEGKRLRGQT